VISTDSGQGAALGLPGYGNELLGFINCGKLISGYHIILMVKHNGLYKISSSLLHNLET